MSVMTNLINERREGDIVVVWWGGLDTFKGPFIYFGFSLALLRWLDLCIVNKMKYINV